MGAPARATELPWWPARVAIIFLLKDNKIFLLKYSNFYKNQHFLVQINMNVSKKCQFQHPNQHFLVKRYPNQHVLINKRNFQCSIDLDVVFSTSVQIEEVKQGRS